MAMDLVSDEEMKERPWGSHQRIGPG